MEPQPAIGPPALDPGLQVAFYYRLQAIRDTCMHRALARTLDAVGLAQVNRELDSYVSPESLRRTASFGLRGEVLFPVPCLLERNPFLVAYYRLLYGLSQKEFYNRSPFGRFRRLEGEGVLTAGAIAGLPGLCRSLIAAGEKLVNALDDLSLDVVRDLQILTLGPQLRGSENTRIGQTATKEVFDLLQELTSQYTVDVTKRTILVRNNAGRVVLIEFASDPDICITEKLPSGLRPLVSIEIKGGRDVSNVHNRLGEAEKSHQKARGRGFFEFWTVVRADVSSASAHRESPTTSHFFHMDAILRKGSKEQRRFHDLLCSVIGIESRQLP
jgi:hypothetical protein